MKRIFVIILSVIVNIINAQTQIFPLDTKGKGVEGVYYKDVNDVLTPYIGIWKGEYGSKNYELKLSKSIYDNGDKIEPLKKDILIGKLKALPQDIILNKKIIP